MSAADKRIQELLDRWLASIEHHVRYLQLDDDAYARAEAWPRHQRPTKWIVDLARTRLLELQAKLDHFKTSGDSSFAEALELMSFLTSLLASEHIERFIPLATGKAASLASVTGTVEQPRLRRDVDKDSSGTRRVPPRRTAAKATPSSPRVSQGAPAQVARSRNSTASRPPSTAVIRRAAAPAPPAGGELTAAEEKLVKTVVADAVRFLDWGTEWPALAGKIVQLAGRPTESQVRSILRAQREAIQQRSKRRID